MRNPSYLSSDWRIIFIVKPLYPKSLKTEKKEGQVQFYFSVKLYPVFELGRSVNSLLYMLVASYPYLLVASYHHQLVASYPYPY